MTEQVLTFPLEGVSQLAIARVHHNAACEVLRECVLQVHALLSLSPPNFNARFINAENAVLRGGDVSDFWLQSLAAYVVTGSTYIDPDQQTQYVPNFDFPMPLVPKKPRLVVPSGSVETISAVAIGAGRSTACAIAATIDFVRVLCVRPGDGVYVLLDTTQPQISVHHEPADAVGKDGNTHRKKGAVQSGATVFSPTRFCLCWIQRDLVFDTKHRCVNHKGPVCTHLLRSIAQAGIPFAECLYLPETSGF